MKSRKSQGIIPEPWQVIYDDAIHHPTSGVVCCVSGLDVVYRTPDSPQPDARKNMLSGRLPAFKKVFEHHALLHHGHYHKIFHDEPVPHGQDRHLRLSLKEGFLEALPISALIATISWQGAMTFLMVVCLHHSIWNQIHMEMHKPEKRFFSHWSTYKFLARYHYLHHKYPHKNFNVVLPLADYVLGTHIRANKSDLEDMSRLGLLP